MKDRIRIYISTLYYDIPLKIIRLFKNKSTVGKGE